MILSMSLLLIFSGSNQVLFTDANSISSNWLRELTENSH